jgi:threonine aldolase
MAAISDFRSDTVTRPTPAMRRAMAECEVGDDVFGDDPTAIALEREAALRFGKEAALFFPSGTMANLAAFLVWCRPGEEAIVEERSHSLNSERGGAARFGGIQLRALASDRGAYDPEAVARAIRGGGGPVERLHQARTALVSIENTHNFWGGRVIPLENVRAVAAAARARGVRVHIDGARIFNAVVASGIEPRAWAEPVDSLMFSLSKGLSAPAGSVLVGSREFIEEARLVRKALGGGMRQVGVLAACGIVALRDMVERLAEDHANARRLAEGLARVPGIDVEPASVETNIVIVRLRAGPEAHGPFVARLRERGVLCASLGTIGVRFVTHCDLGREDVERAIEAARAAAAS